MAKYFVENGALCDSSGRLIECDTSAAPANKISQEFALRIAYGLNMTEPGALKCLPNDDDLDKLEALAKDIIKAEGYVGRGGSLEKLVREAREIKKERDAFLNAIRDVNGFPLKN